MRIIYIHYFVKDRLVLFFSDWTDAIESAILQYTNTDGVLKNLPLTRELVETNYSLIPEAIDFNKPVILKRSGRVEGCENLIVFDPYQLSKDKIYTSDFKLLLRNRYGQTEVTESFVSTLEELEIDYAITSFEDILNCPNLKTLILGKNRYLNLERVDPLVVSSELYDKERSVFVLNVANEILGIQVERYNQHFLSGKVFPYIKEMGNPLLPQLTYLNTKNWEFECSEKDEYPYDSHLERLFDGDFKNWWQPQINATSRVFEIIVDMKIDQLVNGIRITQKEFDQESDFMSNYLLPNMIKVKVSRDRLTWEDATFVEENILGVSSGETTILYLKKPKEVRYLKFIVNDQAYGNNFSVALGKLAVF